MKTKYLDFINQSYDFPQEEFQVKEGNLFFHNIDLSELIKKHGTPLKFAYLPQISNNIQKAKKWFKAAMRKHEYQGKYFYCYCTKSSHFLHVLDEALKNDIHIETSSAFDIDIVKKLKKDGKITNKTFVV
jgi:arginine decarboxylase